MNSERPDMKSISEQFRIFERPSAKYSRDMYNYILAIEKQLVKEREENENLKCCKNCSN